MYRRILGPVYDKETESWRILTEREIYVMVTKPTIAETIRLNRLFGLDMYREWERAEFPKKVLSMNLGTKSLRGRTGSRWQDEVRKDGRLVGGNEWRERVHNRGEWKTLLRTVRNLRILHMSMNE